MRLDPPPLPDGHAPEPPRDPLSSPGTGSRIWLVRHGHVGHGSGTYGDTDVPLSERGLGETRAAIESLAGLEGLRAVFSSPLSRARTMGQGLAEATGLPLALRDGWKEIHRGEWQGIERDDYRARWGAEAAVYWADPLHWRGHGGEAEADLVARGVPLLEEAARAAAGDVAVVTAHRQILRAVIAAALGVAPGVSHGIRFDTSSGTLLEDSAHGWVLHRTNVIPAGAKQLSEPDSGPPEDVFVGHSTPRP